MSANLTHFPGRPGRACYVPPPCDCSDYQDVGTVEFSGVGRSPHSYGFIVVLVGFLIVVAGIAFAVHQ